MTGPSRMKQSFSFLCGARYYIQHVAAAVAAAGERLHKYYSTPFSGKQIFSNHCPRRAHYFVIWDDERERAKEPRGSTRPRPLCRSYAIFSSLSFSSSTRPVLLLQCANIEPRESVAPRQLIGAEIVVAIPCLWWESLFLEISLNFQQLVYIFKPGFSVGVVST